MAKVKSAVGRIATLAVVAVAGGGLLSTAAVSAAQAKGEYYYYNSDSDPLTVNGYGSTAKGFGQWRVADSSNGTRSWLDTNLWYSNASDHKAYSVLATQTNCKREIKDGSSVVSCGGWNTVDSKESPHQNVPGVWKWVYASTGLDSISSQARAQVIVCIDVPARYDPCSNPAYAGPTSF
jgi:hypothetical protein